MGIVNCFGTTTYMMRREDDMEIIRAIARRIATKEDSSVVLLESIKKCDEDIHGTKFHNMNIFNPLNPSSSTIYKSGLVMLQLQDLDFTSYVTTTGLRFYLHIYDWFCMGLYRVFSLIVETCTLCYVCLVMN